MNVNENTEAELKDSEKATDPSRGVPSGLVVRRVVQDFVGPDQVRVVLVTLKPSRPARSGLGLVRLARLVR